jgi:hypothetical protein
MAMKAMRGLTVVLLLAAGGCGQEGFREITSAAGGYRVQMPGNPREQVKDSAIGPLHVQASEEADGTYVVGYIDLPYPENEKPEVRAQRLNKLRGAVLDRAKGKLVGDRKITLADRYPGWELTTESANQQNGMRMRIYLVNRRFYQLTVAGTHAFVSAPEADTFLASFALTQ